MDLIGTRHRIILYQAYAADGNGGVVGCAEQSAARVIGGLGGGGAGISLPSGP